MKHTSRYIASIALAATLFSSCGEKWVDTKPMGQATTAFFLQSDKDLREAAASLYVPMRYESTWGRDLFWVQNASDDLVVGRVKADGENIKNFIPSGREGYLTSGWNDLYWMLNKANQIIESVPNAKNVTESVKNRTLGEAYFIRGFAHFWIAYVWGHKDQGVPFDAPGNEGYGKRIPPQLASVTDNYAQVIKDLEKAAELLPFFESYGAGDYGRAHKAAAWGYMVKTYAYWAQYDQTKWQLVPALCDKIKTEGKRGLINNKGTGAQNYKAVFTIAENWSSEYIWSVNSGVQGGSEFPGVVLENTGWAIFNGWGYFQPTLELYNEYEATDPRRSATILQFGDKFNFFGKERSYWSTNSLSGFQMNKYMEPYSYGQDGVVSTNKFINPDGNYPTTMLNLPLMRYAEILLFKAEALIMTGKAGDAAAPLNEIRSRVGLLPISSPTMADLKHERRVELACEWTDRLQDLKRWGDFAKINAPLHGRKHSAPSDPNSPFTIQEIWPARKFDPNRHMAWPISPVVIANSQGQYNQTPGWQ